MPVFEYKCNDCNAKYEVLVKSTASESEITCPKCSSVNHKKLFSSFSAKVSSGSDLGGCSDGSCHMNQNGACSSGMCGLN